MGRNLWVSRIVMELARFYWRCQQVPYKLQKKSSGVFNKISLYHFPFYDVYCVCFAAFKLVIVLAWLLRRQHHVIKVDPRCMSVIVLWLSCQIQHMIGGPIIAYIPLCLTSSYFEQLGTSLRHYHMGSTKLMN